MDTAAGVHVIEDAGDATAVLHPVRLKMLAELDEPDSAAGLARRLGISRQQANYHVRQLEAAGLVELVGERRQRGCMERLLQAVAHSYLIAPSTLGEVAAEPRRVEDQTSSGYLVAAAAQVIGDVSRLEDGVDPSGRPVQTLTIQADVHLNSPGLQRSFTRELSEAVRRVIARYHDEGAVAGRGVRVLVGAYPAPASQKDNPTGTTRSWRRPYQPIAG